MSEMKMLLENENIVTYGMPRIIGGAQIWEERAIVARFVVRVNALGSLSQASLALKARLLEEVKSVALCIDGSTEVGMPSSYDRRVLYEDPDRWSLAAIILRPGQETHPHDHGGWGCAVTVQGIERDRRFVQDDSGNLVPHGERDYPLGTGYVFDAVDVHQPFGADPQRVTVALHFLVHDHWSDNPNPETIELPEWEIANAA